VTKLGQQFADEAEFFAYFLDAMAGEPRRDCWSSDTGERGA